MVTTEKYIPGRSVLGVLADRFIKHKKNIPNNNPHEDNDFYSWFLEGNLKIGNAYIFSRDKYENGFVHFPVPFSIQKGKNEDVIYDFLYTDSNFDIQTESINTFCVLNEGIFQTKDVETELNFHHARDREKGISKKGVIYNYESISPNQDFEGEIRGEKKELQNLINTCGKDWTAYIGRSKNSQYGRVSLNIIDAEPKPYEPEIESKEKISLTFLSDTIIYNDYGFATTDIGVLENYLGKVKIEKCFIKRGEVESFVGVWKLKRPSETCFLAGSAFLLDMSDSDTKRLAEFQKNGIGERTHEGFGMCKFGWQSKMDGDLDELIESESDDFIIKEELSGPIPDKAEEILGAIIRDSIKKQVELEALNDQNEFERLPSNSLISRLQAIAKRSEQKDFVESIKKLRKSARDQDRKSTRLNSSHTDISRMPSSA